MIQRRGRFSPTLLIAGGFVAVAAAATVDEPAEAPNEIAAPPGEEDAFDEPSGVHRVTSLTCCTAAGCSAATEPTACSVTALAETSADEQLGANAEIAHPTPQDYDYADNPALVPARVLSCTEEHVSRRMSGESGRYAPGVYALCEVILGDICEDDAAATAVAWRVLPFGDDGLGFRALRVPQLGKSYGIILGPEGRTLRGAPLVVVAQEVPNPC